MVNINMTTLKYHHHCRHHHTKYETNQNCCYRFQSDQTLAAKMMEASTDLLLLVGFPLPTFYLQSFRLKMLGWTQGVCLCVSVSDLQLKPLGRFWWNFKQIVSRTWASVIFLRFWISQFDDVLAAILHFSWTALSRSPFWSDFVQIKTQSSLKQPCVCYWK